MDKYKAQLKSEEERNSINIEMEFNNTLNKPITKYNCLKLWEIEILDTMELTLKKETEQVDKINTELFNKRKAPGIANKDAPLLASDGSVKNYLDFRKSQLKNDQK